MNIHYQVMVNGCFDLMHPGHIDFLRFCIDFSTKFDYNLCIFLNSDDSIKRLKGDNRPIYSFEDRRSIIYNMILEQSNFIQVYKFDEDNISSYLSKIKPKFWIKGSTTNSSIPEEELEVVKRQKISIIHYVSYEHIEFSTTKIIERIKNDSNS